MPIHPTGRVTVFNLSIYSGQRYKIAVYYAACYDTCIFLANSHDFLTFLRVREDVA